MVNEHHEIIGTCAYGAAIEAIGNLVAVFKGDVSKLRPTEFEWAYALLLNCPATWSSTNLPVCISAIPLPVSTLIAHLNDNHRWTRERIADWVEGIELPLELQKAEEPHDSIINEAQELVTA